MILLVMTIIVILILFSTCGKNSEKTSSQSTGQVSTSNEVYSLISDNAYEESENVNGKRFNTTLLEFTERYNESKRALGENDLVMSGNWRKNGEETVDDNGVKIQYYYYDDENVNFTATVEVESKKILNIGCGTTMNNFMMHTDEVNNSEIILKKAALMAQSVCQFKIDNTNILQDVFYKTTTDKNDTLWYQGCVYKLSTQEDRDDSKNNIMLFRVFPISESLKQEWKLTEYESIAD